jgi:hypothetical protein
MSTIVEEASDTPTSVRGWVSLIAVPAIALTLLAALALRQDPPRPEPAAVRAASATASTPATLSPRDDGDYTLYILSSGAQAAQQLTDLGGSGPQLGWYAYVSTPDEEAEIMRAWDHADWIRYESGLPPIRVVDLRLPAASVSAHGVSHKEEQ